MATQSPIFWLEDTLRRLGTTLGTTLGPPPAWAVAELQRRLITLCNHILQQEPQALARLVRQKGRMVRVQWDVYSLQLVVTPAGLLDLAADADAPDLTLTLTQTSAVTLAQALLQGTQPTVHIAGDVQLAAEVNWLVHHVRWDIEEDVARLLGDAPAHLLGQAVRAMAQAVQTLLQRQPSQPATTPGPSA